MGATIRQSLQGRAVAALRRCSVNQLRLLVRVLEATAPAASAPAAAPRRRRPRRVRTAAARAA
jgi:hypothetical protein